MGSSVCLPVCPTRSLYWEELKHCWVTPMQKQDRQPSLFSELRWKFPGLQLPQVGPSTFI